MDLSRGVIGCEMDVWSLIEKPCSPAQFFQTCPLQIEIFQRENGKKCLI